MDVMEVMQEYVFEFNGIAAGVIVWDYDEDVYVAIPLNDPTNTWKFKDYEEIQSLFSTNPQFHVRKVTAEDYGEVAH